MSRNRSSGSYGHHLRRIDDDAYTASWVVDRYYKGDRLRYPRGYSRVVDLAGAERFAKRWDIKLPEKPR